MSVADYEVGAVFESRDQQYEPGRRIRLVHAHMDGKAGVWLCETIANPRRRQTVGRKSSIAEKTLRTKWRPTAEGAPTALLCDLCTRRGDFREPSAAHAPCCSSHGKLLCCACYRRSHFVEVGPCCSEWKATHGG